MTCPCWICEERFVGCHAKCDVFKAWHNEQMEKRREKYRQNNREDLLDDFKKASIAKSRQGRRKRK